jgi:hypothetical protein
MTGAERNSLVVWDARLGSTEIRNITPQSSRYRKNFALA